MTMNYCPLLTFGDRQGRFLIVVSRTMAQRYAAHDPLLLPPLVEKPLLLGV